MTTDGYPSGAKAPDEAASRLPLDPATVEARAPEGAGVLTLRDGEGQVLKVEFAPSLRELLTYYATKGPLQPDVLRRAEGFDFVRTDDAGLAATLFDRVVSETGAFPLCQTEAPEGSSHRGKADPGEAAAALDALVTRYEHFSDTELLDRIRQSLEADPDNGELEETYAFLLYSSGALDEAIDRYERLAASEEAKAIHHFYLGNAYYKKKRIEEAISAWSKVADMSPRSRAGLKAARRARKARELLGSAA